MKNKPNIVVLGGGTGTFAVLTGLKKYDVQLTAIVTMSDDGGSTGKLRDEFGVLPPGDVRRSLVALSASENLLRELFEYRFENGAVKGHTFGNLFLTALQDMTGDFNKALEVAGKVLRIRGNVLPVTLDDTRLVAELENGEVIRGETNIDIPKHNSRLHIKKIWLDPIPCVNPACTKAIESADMIVLAPGDLYTSLVPNLLVEGISESICTSSAKKVYVANLMTKIGETHEFTLSDLIQVVERYLGCSLDFVINNTETPSQKRLEQYSEQGSEVIKNNYEQTALTKLISKPLVEKKGFIRHNPETLAVALIQCLES